MSVLKIFFLDHDKESIVPFSYFLSLNPDNNIEVYSDAKECFRNLDNKPDIICINNELKSENIDNVLFKVKNQFNEAYIIILSNLNDSATIVQYIKNGVYDYILKTENNAKKRLWNTINNIKAELDYKRKEKSINNNSNNVHLPEIIGHSEMINDIHPLINKASKSDITVTLFGETGTGKDVIAKTIHYNSDRKNQPFVPVNVTAIPRDLIEAELFGFERGAFTGAINRRLGKFEEAQNGTIFLDEIGEMDITVQAKLLRVLQEQQVVRIGSNKAINLNVRVIVASHKNLFEEVTKGNFREDLYYRLLGLSIYLPALRERGDDIVLFAEHFIKEYCQRNAIPEKKLSSAAIKKLLSHNFPGNVRELKALIELSIVMCENNTITEDNIIIKQNNFNNELLSKQMTLEEYNQLIIEHYLKRYNNKVRPVAEALGIGKSTIYRMLSKKEDF